MKHLAVWKIYGAFSPCDLATANNLNAETLYKVANATYKFVKGQNRLNTVIWLSLVGSLMSGLGTSRTGSMIFTMLSGPGPRKRP